MKTLIIFLTLSINTCLIMSQVTKQWEHFYEYFGMNRGNGVSVVINKLNEPVVLGQQWGWEQTPIVHIYKLNSQTGGVLWDRSPSYSEGQYIFCDSLNNIFVSGYIKEGFTWKFPFLTKYNNAGNAVFYNTDPTDAYGPLYSACFDSKSATYHLKKYLFWVKVTKFDSSGNIPWSNYFTPADTFKPGNITVNNISKEIILTGSFRNNGLYNLFLLKIDSNGNSIDTARIILNNLYDINFSYLNTDAGSNIFFSGRYNVAPGDLRIFIYKLSPMLDTIWGKTINTNQAITASILNIQSDGSLIINYTNGLIKYDSLGNTLWTYTTGKYFNIITGKDNFIYSCGTDINNKYLTSKFNQSGVVIWSIIEQTSSFSNNDLFSIALDSNKEVYVHGNGYNGAAARISTIKYSQVTSINTIKNSIPVRSELFQNYPNPFNPSTTLSFSLSKKSKVELIIYDISGKEIFKLSHNYLNPGTYKFNWNASNQSSGIYFIKFITNSFSDTKKMIIIK